MGIGLQVKLEFEHSQDTILSVWEHDRSGKKVISFSV